MKKSTSHINHNEVINADGSRRAGLVGRVAVATVGGGWPMARLCLCER